LFPSFWHASRNSYLVNTLSSLGLFTPPAHQERQAPFSRRRSVSAETCAKNRLLIGFDSRVRNHYLSR